MNAHQDALFIDIGSNVGQYSLYAAQLNHTVIAVEPYYESIIRLHKAAIIGHVENRILLLHNAVSNERNQVIYMKKGWPHISQAILDQSVFREQKDEFMVKTIWLDDIVEYLPQNKKHKEFKTAIMKIGLAGFETFNALAFRHARRLLQKIDVVTIFMEWTVIVGKKSPKMHPAVEELMDLFIEFNYQACDINYKPLQTEKWSQWPGNIIWIKHGTFMNI